MLSADVKCVALIKQSCCDTSDEECISAAHCVRTFTIEITMRNTQITY